MTPLIDDETATRYWSERDTAPEAERESRNAALIDWAKAKKADQFRAEQQQAESAYTDLEGWWKENGAGHVFEKDEDRLEVANRRFIANQFQQTPDQQGRYYPTYRDEYLQKTFGKSGLSETDTFNLIRDSLTARKETEAALRELPGALAKGIFSKVGEGKTLDETDSWFLFQDWKDRHADKLGKLPEGWESAMLDRAVKLQARSETMMRDLAPESKRAFDTLMAFTRPEDAEALPEAGRADVENISKEFAKLTPEDRQNIYSTLYYAAEADGAGMGKGFFEKVGEGIARGGVNIYNDAEMTAQDRQARQNISYFQSLLDKPEQQPDRMQTAESIQMQRDMAQKGVEENTQRLAELKALREIRQIADGTIDPIKTEMDGVMGEIVQGAYDFAPSLPYMGLAAVPYVGFPATMGALTNSNYLRMLDAYPDMDADAALGISAAVAAPQAIIERFQGRALIGKSPTFNALMRKMTDVRIPIAGRLAIGYGVNVGVQTGQEYLQEAMPVAADQIAAAIRSDMPEFDADKAWGAYKEQMPEIFYSMLWGGLIGTGASTFREFKRNGQFERSLGELEMVGITGEAAQDIAAEQDLDVANAKFQEAWGKRTPEDIQAGIAKRAAQLETARSTQQNPELPVRRIEENADGTLTHIIEKPDGTVLYRTNDSDAADTVYMQQSQRVTANDLLSNISTVTELRNQWLSEDPTNVAIEAEAMTAQQKLEKLQAAGNVAQIEELHRRIATSPYKDTPYDKINILGEATVEDLGEMVFRGVITLNKNSKPEDAREEIHHVAVRKALMKGSVTLDTLKGWLDATETALPDKFPGLVRDNENDIVESLARVQRAYEDGKINADEEMALPASFVDYIKRMLKAFKEVLQRAVALRGAFKQGILPGDYESFLAESVGLNQQTMVDTTRERVGGELTQGTFNYSIGSMSERIAATAVIDKDGQILSSPLKTHAQLMEESAYDLDRGEFPPTQNFGFVTTTGRFVLQQEAQQLAQQAKQVQGNQPISGEIVSGLEREGRLNPEVDPLDGSVSEINKILREVGDQMDRGLTLQNYATRDDLPEFQSSAVDDAADFADYLTNDLASQFPKEFADRIKSAAGNILAHPVSTDTNYSIGTPQFKGWFGESKVVDSDGKPMVVFHGTQRADRVGDRFRKSRATSGPMAFFTNDPAIASSYSTNKRDTSAEMPSDYAEWFKYKGKGMRSPVAIDRAWWNLSPEERAAVNERIYTIGYSDWYAVEGPIVADSQSIMSRDSIDYELRQARGNGLRALVEMWLSSGTLFNQEERFLEVLQAAGVKGATLDDPNAARSAVYPVYLSIKNPLDTASIPGDVVSALEQAGKRKRAKQSAGKNPDGWDKNTISGNDWMAALKEDIAKGTTYAWTRIPDWVTETLSSFGYDGIKDTGGKRGGMQHQVWIPFNETQVKSATGNRGTFDPTSANINYSIGKNYSNEEKYNQIVPEISSVNPNKVSRRDMYEVAKVSPDVASNMSFEKPIEVSLFADGTLMLSDGHHRLAAAKQLGMNSIPAVVRSINAKGNHINALIAEQQPGATNYSIGKAADLASKNPELAKEIQKKSDALLNAAEQGNDVFFTKFWPQMLKKTGMNFKPTKANLLKAAETGMPEILEWLKSNPQYLDYYHKDWELTHDILKAVFPKMTDDDLTGFRIFTGITSPNTKLMHNMADAVQLFNLWMDKGSIKSMRWEWSAKGNRKVGGGPFTFSGTTGAGKTFTAHVLEDLHGKLGSWESVKNYLWEGVSIKELNAFNKEAGYKGTVDAGKIRQVVQSATGQSELIPRMFIFGPKVGAYTLNTSGDDRYTTTDIWEGRFIRSHFPAMFNDADGLPTSVEENKIFQEFAQAFNEVFKRESGLDLPPSALQAVRWFYMLNHAKKAGYKYASTDDTISGYTERAVRLKLGINPRPAGAGGTGSDQANNGAPVQKGDTNYSIASQSEIDRVNKALGGMNRGPDERLKVYERAKQKFSKLMSWNSDELGAMADTGSDETQIRRNQLLQGFGELDAILQVLPPEVRGRVGGYTVLANIAPMDVFKDGVKVSEAKNMDGAIISAWMKEGQNIGQAGKQVSLPPGYTAKENLASKRADKALADFFRDRIKKIDTELEKVLAREYRTAILDLVKKSRPKAGDNNVRKSTLGPETQKLADLVQRATLMDEDAVAERMLQLEQTMATSENSADMVEEWGILNQFGDLKNRNSETLAQAYGWFKDQLKLGREAWRIKEEARIAENRERAKNTVEFIGGATAVDRFKDKTFMDRVSDWANSALLDHASFEQFVAALLPPDVAADFSKRLRKADVAAQKAEIDQREGILNALREGAKAAGTTTGKAMVMLKTEVPSAVRYLDGRKVKNTKLTIEQAEKIVRGEIDRGDLTDTDVRDLSDELAALPADTRKENITIRQVVYPGKEVRLPMTRGKAIQLLLSWNQPDVQDKMRREGWTEDSITDLRELTSDPVSQAMISHAQELYGKGAGITNPVYSRMFGMNMPQVKNYAPTRFLNAKDTKDIGLDGSPVSTGTTPSFAKSRVSHSAKIAPEDALSVMQQHILMQAHWVNFAELAREYRSLLNNPEVREAIKTRHGSGVLKTAEQWADQMEQRGGNQAREAKWVTDIIGSVIGGQSVASLGFNLKSIAMQLDNALRFGLALDKKQIASAMSSPDQLIKDIKTVFESDALQTRLRGGATAETRYMFERFGGRPGTAAKVTELSMKPMNWMDVSSFSFSAAIVYRANLNEAMEAGMPESLARETALDAASAAIYRFSQPVSFGQKSNVENSGNMFTKAFFLFMSDPRLKAAIMADAVRGLATGRGDKGTHIRRLVAVELMAVLSHVVASSYRDAFTDDEDDDIWSLGGWVRAIALAPVQGYLFIGTMLDSVLSQLTGAGFFTPTQNPLLTISQTGIRALKNADDILAFDDPDALLKEWIAIARTMAVAPGAAMPAVLLNLVKPIFGAADNATTEE
jgi:hypothetical protein